MGFFFRFLFIYLSYLFIFIFILFFFFPLLLFILFICFCNEHMNNQHIVQSWKDWVYKTWLVSFRFSSEVPVWSLLHVNK